MTRAETVAKEIAERYPEMMPAWRASLTRQITAALVAFGREAVAQAADGRFQDIADAIVDAATPDLVSTWPPGTLAAITKAAIRALPPGAPDAHAPSKDADPEEVAIERAHDEARQHAGEDSPYA